MLALDAALLHSPLPAQPFQREFLHNRSKGDWIQLPLLPCHEGWWTSAKFLWSVVCLQVLTICHAESMSTLTSRHP